MEKKSKQMAQPSEHSAWKLAKRMAPLCQLPAERGTLWKVTQSGSDVLQKCAMSDAPI
jgi:hypothetical protein